MAKPDSGGLFQIRAALPVCILPDQETRARFRLRGSPMRKWAKQLLF
jgi:hypothetical protein